MNLPLTDGAFLIDNSALEKLSCPREFYYSFVRRRRLVSSKAGMNFGSTMHVAWAERYAQCGGNAITPNATIRATLAMTEWLDSNPQPAEDFRNLSHACRVFDAYNQNYGNEPYTILTNPKDGELLVEKSFMLPFMTVRVPATFALAHGIPLKTDPKTGAFYGEIIVYYCGKIDLGIRDAHGIWVQDHKTSFQFGDSFDKDMQRNAGQRGYFWSLMQILGEMPRGYIIDAVRIRKPKRDSIFDGTPPVDASDFRRLPFFVTQNDIDTWKVNTEYKVREIFYHAQNDYWPEHENMCTAHADTDTHGSARKFGTCDFFDVCSVAKEMRENALASNLYEDNLWSPLNKPKEQKEGVK